MGQGGRRLVCLRFKILRSVRNAGEANVCDSGIIYGLRWWAAEGRPGSSPPPGAKSPLEMSAVTQIGSCSCRVVDSFLSRKPASFAINIAGQQPTAVHVLPAQWRAAAFLWNQGHRSSGFPLNNGQDQTKESALVEAIHTGRLEARSETGRGHAINNSARARLGR